MKIYHSFLTRQILLATLLEFLCFGTLAASAGSTYTVQALTMPARAFSGQASAINDAGVSAGWYQTNRGWSAVSWSAANELTQLGTLPGLPNALANGINQAGTIVGFAFSADFLTSRGFIWRSDTGMQPLTDLGGGASLAQAINADGTAVGWAYDPAGVLHAVRWSASGSLTDLNPAGAISEALGINDSGDVVGWVFPAGEVVSHAYLWRHDGVEIDLGTLGGPSSQAFGVNNALAIVGVADQPSPLPPVAFIWKPATGMRSLDWGGNSQALAISDLGRPVGFRIINRIGIPGLTRFRGTREILPDLAPDKPPFSGPTGVNPCGTIVGSSSSPKPTNGNPVPAIWTKLTCD
jgi:probable HAF family extracellular repeat protein/YD repeat-containing protein